MINIDKTKPDWNRIKGEYLAGGISQRELAEKYGLSSSTLQKRARKEGWGQDRKRAGQKIAEKVVQKAAQKNADNATLAADIRRKGLILLDGLFEDFAVSVKATEHRESRGGITDIKRLRDLTAAYKDLTDDLTKQDTQDNPILDSLFRLLGGGSDGH